MSEFPRIGIRPTIDGRERGVRESLEEQTMGMATSVAELLSSTLHYPDGTPVECVIADTTIGGIAEAAAAATKFRRENVGLTITVTPCWCYGTETMDMDPSLPHAVWGFNGTERPGAVYLAAVLAAHAQKGIPAFGIYGEHVQDEFGGLTRVGSGSGETVFTSGVIDDSTALNAWLTAVKPVPASDFGVRSVTIGPLQVTLRYWADDPGWADQVERVLRSGYPVLRDLIGLGDPT